MTDVSNLNKEESLLGNFLSKQNKHGVVTKETRYDLWRESKTKDYITLTNLESILEELVMDCHGKLSMKIDVNTARELGDWLVEECNKVK